MNRCCFPRAIAHAGIVALTVLALPFLAQAKPVDDNPPAGWWRDATFYEIFVRSFADSRTGALAGDGVGDLQGLIDHLDYLNDGRDAESAGLGINAIWLMPIQPSPSYHGYDVTDYFAVNPSYGDIALMKRFVTEAHRRGIRVIIDLVLNHSSSQHPLFRAAASGADPRARGLFRFAPAPQDIAGPWDQRVWHPSKDEFYYGVFGADMPDWNFRDAGVTDHHRKAAALWLREVGVDGFRLDAVRYFYEQGDALQDTEETRRWLRDFTAYCHTLKPGAFVVGEDTAGLQDVARCIRGGSLDSAFEFSLARATVEAIRLRAPDLLRATLERLAGLYERDSPWSTFLSNHDQERILSQLGEDPRAARFAAKLLFTLPGVPFVYYGEEIGMTGRKPDPELRTPMPWTAELPNAGFAAPKTKAWHPVTGDYLHANVAVETRDPESLLTLYRRLIRLNAGSAALRHGKPLPLVAAGDDRKVCALMRETDHEAVLILANFDSIPHACPALSLDRSHMAANWKAHEEIESAPVSEPTITSAGGFSGWKPRDSLPAESVYVVRWSKP